MVHPWFWLFRDVVAVGRFGDDVRGRCDDRIDLYPAAPIWLATMLYARTIALRIGLI